MPKSKNKRKSKSKDKKERNKKIDNYFKRFLRSFNVQLNKNNFTDADSINDWLDVVCEKMMSDHVGDEHIIIKGRNKFVRFLAKKMEESKDVMDKLKDEIEAENQEFKEDFENQ